MPDEGGRTLELVAAHGYSTDFVARYRSIPLDSDLAVADVVRRGQAAWIERAREQPGYPELEEATEATRADALALVPLRSVGRTFGFVALRFTEGRTWSDAERALVEGLADQCAESLERARLYEREHQTALTLQHSVLPEQLPEIPAVRLSARYVPGGRTGHVGGDWYDVVELPEGGAAAVVGDVVGKGVQAASAMAQLRNALRVFALEGYKPSTVLSRVNRLARSTGFSFATLVYLVLDADAASCRFASAGHLPPLVIEEDGSAWFVEGGRSLPIGVADDTDYRQEGFAVPRGATILLYTDGLVERRNESLDEGLERLRTVAAQFIGGPSPHARSASESRLTLQSCGSSGRGSGPGLPRKERIARRRRRSCSRHRRRARTRSSIRGCRVSPSWRSRPRPRTEWCRCSSAISAAGDRPRPSGTAGGGSRSSRSSSTMSSAWRATAARRCGSSAPSATDIRDESRRAPGASRRDRRRPRG